MAELHSARDSNSQEYGSLKATPWFEKKGSVSNQSLSDIVVALAKPNRG
jgi:hypothetical protein